MLVKLLNPESTRNQKKTMDHDAVVLTSRCEMLNYDDWSCTTSQCDVEEWSVVYDSQPVTRGFFYLRIRYLSELFRCVQ